MSAYDLPHTVYLHRAADGEVLYVGCTSNFERRTADHKRRAYWRAKIANVEIDSVHPDMWSGRTRENDLIAQYEPPHNRQRNPAVEREKYAWDALAERFGIEDALVRERAAGSCVAALASLAEGAA